MDSSKPMDFLDSNTKLLGASVLALFSAVSIYLVSYIGYNLFLHPLRSYPGPKSWAALRLPWAYHQVIGDNNDKMLEFHKKYGTVIRIAPDELSYANSQAWRDVYAHRPGQPEMSKTTIFQASAPNKIPSILGATKENHARFRKLLSYAFSEKGMREQEPRIKEHVDLLITRLQELAETGESQDVLLWYTRAAFDIIGDLAFGESFHSLSNKKTHDWMRATWDNLRFVMTGNIFKLYGFGFLMAYLLPKGTVEGRLRNFQYTQTKVEARLRYGSERGDFWDKIVIKSEDDNAGGQGMTKGEMLNNAAVLVFAGSDTVATLTSGMTYLLSKHPDKLAKLTQEIRSTYKSSDDMDLINVGQLKYLPAVMDESLRVYPAVPVQIARIVPNGGAMINGKFVPAGVSVYNPSQIVIHQANNSKTSVNVQQHPSYHLESNFYRPDDFIPERWLENRDPVFQNDDRAAHQPFGVGPRNCIGKNLAYAETKLIMCKVLWNFDISLDEAKMGAQGEWLNQKSYGLWEKKPLWVNLTQRKN
ncbi:MAG: hypothetical protein Q9165_007617 [Trypethelium subeluteriae]